MWPAPSACLSDGPGHEAGRGVFSFIRLIKLVVVWKKEFFNFSFRVIKSHLNIIRKLSDSQQKNRWSFVSHITYKHWRTKGFSVLFGFPLTLLLQGIKFMFSKKATKIDEIFTADLTLCSKCQINGEDFVNFCGLRERPLMTSDF